jgi:hypothetical protein
MASKNLYKTRRKKGEKKQKEIVGMVTGCDYDAVNSGL